MDDPRAKLLIAAHRLIEDPTSQEPAIREICEILASGELDLSEAEKLLKGGGAQKDSPI